MGGKPCKCTKEQCVKWYPGMGVPSSDNGQGVSSLEEGGFHIFEIHIPTAHIGLGIFVVLAVLALVGLLACRFQRRRRDHSRTHARHHPFDMPAHFSRRGGVDRTSFFGRRAAAAAVAAGLFRGNHRRDAYDLDGFLPRGKPAVHDLDCDRFEELGPECDLPRGRPAPVPRRTPPGVVPVGKPAVIQQSEQQQEGASGGYYGEALP